MKRLFAAILSIGLIAGLAVMPVLAQQQGAGSPTTQTGTRGDAALRCDSATSGTAVNTLTLQNPGAGLSNYITYIGAWGGVSGSVVTTTPTAVSTTGFTGTTPNFMPINTATTATLVTGGVGGSAMVFNPPIKGNANTGQTLTGGAVISGITSIVQSCYYPAP